MVSGEPSAVYVALDLETTGLNADRDAIIEVGAAKFQGAQLLDTFQTLVNPYRDIPGFVRRLTGISQKDVDQAPPFAVVAGELSDFIAAHPIVGHNISFDLRFLSSHGLQVASHSYDTWDLASILLPHIRDYSLGSLVSILGADHPRPHRALDDAMATRGVFLVLLERAAALDPAIRAYISVLSARAGWRVGSLLGDLALSEDLSTSGKGASDTGLTGLNLGALGKRIGRGQRLAKGAGAPQQVDEEEIESLLGPEGPLARQFPGYEYRPQQAEMAKAVACAINGEGHLIVEGGTGVGKSLAYLLPAILHSVRNGTRVVVSTNTINLQEQLLTKDIPAVARVLEEEGLVPEGEFRAVPLKGRANYVCLRRWSRLAGSEDLSGAEVRLLGKVLVWLQETSLGDRAEINLSGEDAITWNQVSASDKAQCPALRGEGPCFLRAARDRAEGAHMVVVNHALLLSDMVMGGGILPEYQHLIVDEAHHLEEGATRQLGYQVAQNALDDILDRLGRLAGEARVLLMASSLSLAQTGRVQELASAMGGQWAARIREQWARMWNAMDRFLGQHGAEGGDQSQVRVTSSSKSQPAWSEVEIAWENVDSGLVDGGRLVENLQRYLESLPGEGAVVWNDLQADLGVWLDEVEELRERLRTLVPGPAQEERIDWMERVDDSRGSPSRRSQVVFHSAPLSVGLELQERLFSKKASVILTSATMSTQGKLDYIRERVGLGESPELVVGSPFDYLRSVLLLLPEDMPLPDTWDYQQALERVLVDLGKSMGGRTLVLFTSHSALRGAARSIRAPLEAEGIRVLAQGVDGSPRHIVEDFAKDPSRMILGTSSFWEGVDLAGGGLKALVLVRLPFHVPTEPIFAARSAQYDDAFNRYALPQAVLRFRQGMGRLIRNNKDRGTMLVLDRRIIARSYGKTFIESIPPCTMKRVFLNEVPGLAEGWAAADGGPDSGPDSGRRGS